MASTSFDIRRDKEGNHKEIQTSFLIESNFEEKAPTKRKEDDAGEAAEEDLFPMKPSTTAPPHHLPHAHDGTTAFSFSSCDAPCTQRLPLEGKRGGDERALRKKDAVCLPDEVIGQVSCVDTFPDSASYTVVTETSSPKPTMTSHDRKSTQINCDRKSR